jgi:tetratricopeptide (TPR) repeat protein
MSRLTYEELTEQGIARLQEEDYDGALNAARELQELEEDTADGYHLEALVYQYQFDWEKSIEALDKAIDCAPYDADLFNIRGFAHLSLGDFKKANTDFEEAINLEDLEAAHRNIVLMHILQDDSEAGIEYLVKRLQHDPEHIENWIFMGDLMMKAGLEDKAKTYYEEAKKLDPEHHDLKNRNV